MVVAIGYALRLNFQMDVEEKTKTVLLPYEMKYGTPIIIENQSITPNISPYFLDYEKFKDSVFSKLIVFHTGQDLQLLGIIEHSDYWFFEESIYFSKIPIGEWWQSITSVEHGLFSHPDMGLPLQGDVPEPCVVVTLEKDSFALAFVGVVIVCIGIFIARFIKILFGE